MAKEEFSKYERARILGARGLQIAMDAPLLLKINSEEMEGVNFDPLKLAELELDSGVLPISVRRPLPIKQKELLTEIKNIEEVTADSTKEREEASEEKEIEESGEIMELIDHPEEEDADETLLSEGKEELE